MANILRSVRVLLLIYTVPTVTGTEFSFETFNKSRARLLRVSEYNLTKSSFYPFEAGGKDTARKYFNALGGSSYVLPEPGCSCVPKAEDCDFECCYCELGCPLAKGIDKVESWLSPMYGNMCKDRRKYGYKTGVAPTFRQRQQKASEKIVLSCDRPDHPINGRMPSFQFICVHADNSYTSFQYPLRPSNLNLIRLTNLSPMKYSWPVLQAFYNNCNNLFEDDVHDKAININEPELLRDERYLLLLRVSQLFHLEPPPLKFSATGKVHPNNDKLCLSYRENVAEILGTGWNSVGGSGYKQNPVDILENAIKNLARRKVNYLANFQPKSRVQLTSCNQFRSFMSTISRVWIQQIMDFAHGNRSNPKTKIPIKHMDPENLSLNRRWEAGLQNESFPDKCYNIAAGLEVHIYFSWESISEIRYQMFTRDLTSPSSPSFFIQLKTLSATKILTSKLSRFWTEFALYDCPDQYCWRDIFDFSHLPAHPVVIVIVFVCMPIVTLFLYAKIGFYELI